MNNKWITDRLPTLDEWYVYDSNGGIVRSCHILNGEPWKPIPQCEPYVKPKRYVVRAAQDIWPNGTVSGYVVWADVGGVHAVNIPTIEAAERIAAIYEEVMP